MSAASTRSGADGQALTAFPWRALLLLGASRLALVVVLVVTAWAVRTTVTGESGDVVVAVPIASMMPNVSDAGRTPSALLGDISARIERAGAILVGLEVGRPDGRGAPVRIQIVTSGARAEEVDRAVVALERSGLANVTPLSMMPVPGGIRIDLEAHVVLAVIPLPPASDTRPLGVRLSAATEQSSAELRRLDVPSDARAIVRMEVSGDIGALVDLLAQLETDHSAPMRFESITVRRVSEGVWEMSTAFRVREAAPSAAGGPS